MRRYLAPGFLLALVLALGTRAAAQDDGDAIVLKNALGVEAHILPTGWCQAAAPPAAAHHCLPPCMTRSALTLIPPSLHPPAGASLQRLLVPDAQGELADVVLGWDDEETYRVRGGANVW